MHSSIYKKDLVCLPVPQTLIDSFAEATFLHNAAGAFSLPPSQVPRGPKILCNLAILVSIFSFRLRVEYKRSLNNFSHPYSLSGEAG